MTPLRTMVLRNDEGPGDDTHQGLRLRDGALWVPVGLELEGPVLVRGVQAITAPGRTKPPGG